MEPIRVPRPPKEAFDQHRGISDLIHSQVVHFRHVESTLSDEQRRSLPQGRIRTEHEAAQYIGAMTRLLLGQPASAAQPQPSPVVMQPARRRPARVLDLAAGETSPSTLAKSAKKAAPRSRKTKNGRNR
jgi:hypothetical protein